MLTSNPKVDDAISCDLTVKAYNHNNAEVASKVFEFKAPTVSASKIPMIQAKLPNTFVNGVYRVAFFLDNYVTKALLLDNVTYCVKR